MKERWSQNSNSHIDSIGKANPLMRWFTEYCATIEEMNHLFSSLAEELAMQRIEVNTLSAPSTASRRLKTLLQQVGLLVCRRALSQLQSRHGLAQSDKNREVADAIHLYKSNGFGKPSPQLTLGR